MMLLLRGSLEGALAVLVAAGFARILDRRRGMLVAIVWWLACARFLLGAAPLPFPTVHVPADLFPRSIASMVDPLRFERPPTVPDDRAREGFTLDRRDLGSTVGVLWAMGFLVSLLPAAIALRRSRGCLREEVSRLASAAELAFIERMARHAGLRRAPAVRFSSAAREPFLFALGRPVVILPEEGWHALTTAEREMVLAHEFVHVRRHDALWSALPWLVARIFWFHPLARWAAREHALAREIACDSEVLGRLNASPRGYGALLVSLGARSPVATSGLAASSPFRSLRRRLVMLETPPSLHVGRRGTLVLALAMLATLAPLRVASVVSGSSRPATVTTSSTDWNWFSRGGETIALVDGDDVRMMGNIAAAKRARAVARERGVKQLVYFTRSGKSWVIDDPAFQARAKDIFAQTAGLDRRQGELGLRQSELGEQQASLDRRQAELGLDMAKIEEELAPLERERQRRVRRDEDTEDLDAGLESLRQRMEVISDAMAEIGDEQSRIGEQQSALWEEQSALGEKQSDELERIWREVKTLIEKARRDGLARSVED